MQKYEIEAILLKLKTLSGWEYKAGFLEKNYKFRDFSEAFAFLTRIALLSETLGHHPDWSGVYNKVTLRLRTHDADGITDKDFEFAQKADSFLN